MTSKRIFLTITALLALTLTATAQTAKSILDQTASLLQSNGGIEATFEGTQFKGTQAVGSTTGKIQVLGNKFKITTDALTTWFDGRTQWSLLAGSDEVNVSTPTAAEVQQLNPYAFVNLYKKGYTLTRTDATYQGKACHEVRLKAQNKSNSIQTLVLTIDKSTHLPHSIRIKDNKGEWTRIRVSGLSLRKKWNDSQFKFDSKQYPGIEIIDLR